MATAWKDIESDPGFMSLPKEQQSKVANGWANEAIAQVPEADRPAFATEVSKRLSPYFSNDVAAESVAPSSSISDFGRRVASETGKQALSTGAGLARFSADMFDQHPILATILTGGVLQPPVSMKRDAANFLADAAGNADAAYGVDQTRNEGIPAKVAQAAGGLINAVPAVLAGGAGVPMLAAQALGGTKEADYQRNIAAGDSEEEAARKSNLSSAIKTSVTLPLYMMGGKAASTLTEMLPNTTPALARIAAQFTANTAANTGASALGRGFEAGMEGKPIGEAIGDISIPGMIQDAAFAANHTLEATRQLNKFHAEIRDNLQTIPTDHLQAFATDPQARKTMPFDPKMIDAELVRRGEPIEPVITPEAESVAPLTAQALRDTAKPSNEPAPASPVEPRPFATTETTPGTAPVPDAERAGGTVAKNATVPGADKPVGAVQPTSAEKVEPTSTAAESQTSPPIKSEQAPADVVVEPPKPESPTNEQPVPATQPDQPVPKGEQSPADLPPDTPSDQGARTADTVAAEKPAQVVESAPIEHVPVADITLSNDVPQFKRGANSRGVVKPLQGEYDPIGNVLQGWRRLDGRIELISGRHRFAKAQESGTESVAMQIHDEAKGFSVQQAARLDAELNIREGHGEVSDYANYFKNSGVTEADAKARGLLGNAKGEAGFSIARGASEDVFALHQAGELTDSQAQAIADGAPGNGDVQRIGTRAALDGKPVAYIRNLLKAFAARGEGKSAKQLDLLGNDDAAMKEMGDQAKIASHIQSELKKTKAAITGASKDPARAKAEGVDVKDPEAVKARVAEINGELARWDNWPMHPDLVARTRGEEAPLPVEPAPSTKEQPTFRPSEDIEYQPPHSDQWLRAKVHDGGVNKLTGKPQELVVKMSDRMGGGTFVKTTFAAPNDLIPIERVRRPQSPQKLEPPTLRPGENQGDLLSKQQEDLTLVGEKGVDHARVSADKAAAEKASAEAKAKVDKEQATLFGSDWTSATEDAPNGMKLGSSEKGFINTAPVKGAVKAIDRLTTPKMRPLDEATTERSLRLQKSFQEAAKAQAEIKKAAPTEKRQAAISVWMEADGDAATLAKWASQAKGKVFKQAAIDAQKLSPKELAIAQKAKGAFSVLEQRGGRYDVLSNHRDNYVPHVWEVEKRGSGLGGSRLKDRFKFNKARTFDTFFDGDQAGFKPKTLAIGKLLPAYLSEMNRVIADRQFIQDVSNRSAKDGRPLLVPRGSAEIVENGDTNAALVNPRGFAKGTDKNGNPIDTSDYEVLGDQPALAKWRWLKTDPDGNTVMMKSDLAVHPELAKRLKAAMGVSKLRKYYNEPAEGLAVIPKAILKNLDTSQSVMKREMFGLLAPFHQVQEGTHAVGHLVNPFFNIPKIDVIKDAKQADGVQHGLMLLPEKSGPERIMEGVGGKGTFLTQILRKFGKPASDAVADVIDGYQDYLFHRYIPGLKVKTYDHILERNMGRFKGEIAKGEINEADVKRMSAEQTNAAYGHLNYALLDRSPTVQHFLQLGLLAPDFLEARGRFVGQALKPNKAGHEQFRAIATLAAIQAGAAYTITTLSGNKWDPRRPFEINIGNRIYTMRSVPEDLFRLVFEGHESRRVFISARVNPLAQKIDQLRTGLNYRGEKTGAMETMGELLASYIPITARSFPGINSLSETSRNNPVSKLEQLAGSMGLKISRYSDIGKTYELANEWMDKQKIPKPEGAYPISKYQRLRYALEDGDMGRAADEYKTLLKDSTPLKLSRGFKQSVEHPFTGTTKSDMEFAASLSKHDRLIYDHALAVKKSMLDKFRKLPGATSGQQISASDLRIPRIKRRE